MCRAFNWVCAGRPHRPAERSAGWIQHRGGSLETRQWWESRAPRAPSLSMARSTGPHPMVKGAGSTVGKPFSVQSGRFDPVSGPSSPICRDVTIAPPRTDPTGSIYPTWCSVRCIVARSEVQLGAPHEMDIAAGPVHTAGRSRLHRNEKRRALKAHLVSRFLGGASRLPRSLAADTVCTVVCMVGGARRGELPLAPFPSTAAPLSSLPQWGCRLRSRAPHP